MCFAVSLAPVAAPGAGSYNFDDGTTQGWTLDQMYVTASQVKFTPAYGYVLGNTNNALAPSAWPLLIGRTDKNDIYLESPDVSADSGWQSIDGYSVDVTRLLGSSCYGDFPDMYYVQLQAKVIDTADGNKEKLFAEWSGSDFVFHEIRTQGHLYQLSWSGWSLSDPKYIIKQIRLRITGPGDPSLGECAPKGHWKIDNVNALTVVTPVVTVAATDSVAGEPGTGQGDGVFTLTRTGDASSVLTTNFSVAGSATEGVDFGSLGTTVQFAAGSATATKVVSVTDDGEAETAEGVVLTLAGGTGYNVGSPSSATVHILDDDGVADDNYEDNDTLATAFDLSGYAGAFLSTIDGQGVQGDDDWYKIIVPAGQQRVQVDCRFADAAGDIDIWLHDAAGTVLASSRSVSDDEFIDFTVRSPGTYCILVETWRGVTGNTYDLMWSVLPDDSYEENDTLAAAYDLSGHKGNFLSALHGFGVQSDQDWYEVTVSAGSERVMINCLFTHGDGDIDLRLTDSSGTVLASSTSVDDNEFIDHTVSTAGTYYIQVSYLDAGNTYDLWWNAGADDSYEENDIQAAAYDLSGHPGQLLSTIDGQGIQSDDDWYRISVPAGQQRVLIDCLFTHAAGDIDLRLVDSSGTILSSSISSSDNESIDFTVPAAGSYYVWVDPFGAAVGNVYDLVWNTLPDDSYEENDVLVSAFDLSGYAGVLLSGLRGLGVQSDDDWYAISVPADQLRVQIDCLFTHAEGDVDIRLADSSGTTLAGAYSTSDHEHIDHTVPGAGTYYIRVYYASAGNHYDLQWSTMLDDGYEDNDSLAAAYDLTGHTGSPLSTLSGYGVQTDEDWYHFLVIPDFGQLTVECLFSHAEGDIDIELTNGSGSVLANGLSITDNETIIFPVVAAGDYYVRVFRANGGNTYDLRWDIDDQYEENDTLATALDLSGHAGSFLSTISTPGIHSDDDWYEINVPVYRQRVVVDCLFAHADGDIDLVLTDPSGTGLAFGTSVSDNEHIDYSVPVPGTYYLKVMGTRAGSPYDLMWNVLPSDLDGDGMTDEYEVLNGLIHTDAGDKLSDHDGDGFSAVFEYGMGTLAGDYNSRPIWEINHLSPTQVELTYGPITQDVTYILKSSPDGRTFSQIDSFTAGADAASHMVMDPTGQLPVELYRLEVLLPLPLP